jgi:hypothetical protein
MTSPAEVDRQQVDRGGAATRPGRDTEPAASRGNAKPPADPPQSTGSRAAPDAARGPRPLRGLGTPDRMRQRRRPSHSDNDVDASGGGPQAPVEHPPRFASARRDAGFPRLLDPLRIHHAEHTDSDVFIARKAARAKSPSRNAASLLPGRTPGRRRRLGDFVEFARKFDSHKVR